MIYHNNPNYWCSLLIKILNKFCINLDHIVMTKGKELINSRYENKRDKRHFLELLCKATFQPAKILRQSDIMKIIRGNAILAASPVEHSSGQKIIVTTKSGKKVRKTIIHRIVFKLAKAGRIMSLVLPNLLMFAFDFTPQSA